MDPITKILSEKVSAAFEKCGYDPALGNVTASDRPDICQFQCNGAFAAAKAYRKPPFVIADDVAAVLSADKDTFKEVVSVKPGFINLTLSDEYISSLVRSIDSDEHCGIPQTEKPLTIVIDYGGPNTAKPLHIGHLRSAIIGESLKRLARACGHKAYGDIHLGDWGLQNGLVIAELSERFPDEKCFSDSFDPEKDHAPELTPELLGEVYPFASAKSKENEEFLAKAHAALIKLHNGHKGYTALWKQILKVSVGDLKEIYKCLNVDFDFWYGESDAAAYNDRLYKILEEKGLSHESDGALVCDVSLESDKSPVPPIIVRKSDGTDIYATWDLSAIIQRQEDLSPDCIWYVVDNRQELHFTQVFRCSRAAGLVPESTELKFLGFGTMNGSDGKPYKTRSGGVMRLSELIKTVTDAALERLAESDKVDPADREEYARRLGMAAIKFGDLINHRSKDYVFDLDKFMSAEGKTGIYLLYTISRINSILKRAGDAPSELGGVYTDCERDLMLRLIMTGDAYTLAMNEKAPNYVCENAYQTAVLFSRFYHECRIIDETDEKKRAHWLALCRLVRKSLLTALDILGIEAVENM